MDATSYSRELLSILHEHSAQALEVLRAFDKALPEKARAIDIVVHVSQDPDGLFTVMIHLDGPDLYVLNKAIHDHRTLFAVRYTDGRVTPKVPLFDSLNPPFEVNDVIVDTCIEWVKELWIGFGGVKRDLPARVWGEEGYGTRGTIPLTPSVSRSGRKPR